MLLEDAIRGEPCLAMSDMYVLEKMSELLSNTWSSRADAATDDRRRLTLNQGTRHSPPNLTLIRAATTVITGAL